MSPHDDGFPLNDATAAPAWTATCSSSPLDICAEAKSATFLATAGSGLAGTAFDPELSHTGVLSVDLSERVRTYSKTSQQPFGDHTCRIGGPDAVELLMNFGSEPDYVPSANLTGDVLSRHLVIDLSQKQGAMLDQLLASGVFGLSIEGVAQTLILGGLRKAIADGWLEL
jgi:hypothetical protein